MAEVAPSLLKGAGIALLICLGLPLLMLLSIPCNLFGSLSASSADIQEMTAQAEQLTVTWKDQRSLEDKAINLFVDLLPENLGFISIEKNLGNTNDYWMIAITSVYSEQDVMLIDEDKIVSKSLVPDYTSEFSTAFRTKLQEFVTLDDSERDVTKLLADIDAEIASIRQ